MEEYGLPDNAIKWSPFLMAQTVKCLPTIWEPVFDPWVRKILWRWKWQPTLVLLPGKSYGRRSLVVYSPWGREESDTAEWLSFHFLLNWWYLVTKSCTTLCGSPPARLLCPWDFPGKNTGVGCHFPFQGIFPPQGSNLRLLIGRQILYHWATMEALLLNNHAQRLLIQAG